MSIKYHLIGIMLVCAGIFVACNIYILIPLYPSISASFFISEQQVAFASFLFTFFYALGLLCFGPISDQLGKKRVMTWGMLCASISTITIYTTSSIEQLYIFRAIQGFVLASFAPVAFSYSFDLYEPKMRTFWLALINSGFLAAGIIGQITSSFIDQTLTWQHVFLFFGVGYFLLFLLFFLFLPNTNVIAKKESNRTFQIMLSLLTNKMLCKGYTIVFTILFSFVAFYDALTKLGLSQNTVFWIRVVGLTGVILSIYTGKLIKKYSLMTTMLLGIVLGISSIACLLLTTSTIWIGLFSIVFVSAISLLIPTVISMIGEFSSEHKGKALSLYSFILLMGASFSSIIANILSYSNVLILLILLFFIDLLLWRSLTKFFKLSKGPIRS